MSAPTGEPTNNGPANPAPGNGEPTNQPSNSGTASGEPNGTPDTFDAAAAQKGIERLKAELQQAKEDAKKYKAGHDAHEKKRKDELPEIEQLKEQLAEAQREIEKHSARQVRMDAAEAANLPVKFAKFITASDPKEALEQAKELAAELKVDEKNSGNSRPDLRQGNRGTPPAPQIDANTLIRRMAGH